MSTHFDRQLIADLVDMEVGRTFNSWPDAERRTRISRASLYRIRDADPNVKHSTFKRLEQGLGLPADGLFALAAHDFDAASEIGVRADTIAWAKRRVSAAGQDRRAQ